MKGFAQGLALKQKQGNCLLFCQLKIHVWLNNFLVCVPQTV